MNVFCLRGKVIGSALALDLIKIFLTARFSNAERHLRRLKKVRALETGGGALSTLKPRSYPIPRPTHTN
jgi:ribose 5-phosphate isomerase RpiB